MGMRRIRTAVKRHTPAWARTVYRALRTAGLGTMSAFFRMLPIRGDRVVFCNVHGYGDNPRYIAEELLRRSREELGHICGQVWDHEGGSADEDRGELKQDRSCRTEIIFITDTLRAGDVPCGIRLLRTDSAAALKALATARIWVDCNRKERYIKKRKGQFYIQTWHGSIPLKRIEGDIEGQVSESYVRNSLRDTAMTDLYISDSDFIEGIYRRAFGYEGEFLRAGSARLDGMLACAADGSEAVGTEADGQEQNGHERLRTVIYAPTFRDGGSDEDRQLDLDDVLETVRRTRGGEWQLLRRLHPHVYAAEGAGGLTGMSSEEAGKKDMCIRDISLEGDLYAYLKQADILITDYSNTMFEFALSGGDVFLYTPDCERYRDDRGFYFDPEQLPFPRAFDAEGLAESIRIYDSGLWKKRQKDFLDALDLTEDGHAAERIVDRILKERKD